MGPRLLGGLLGLERVAHRLGDLGGGRIRGRGRGRVGG